MSTVSLVSLVSYSVSVSDQRRHCRYYGHHNNSQKHRHQEHQRHWRHYGHQSMIQKHQWAPRTPDIAVAKVPNQNTKRHRGHQRHCRHWSPKRDTETPMGTKDTRGIVDTTVTKLPNKNTVHTVVTAAPYNGHQRHCKH